MVLCEGAHNSVELECLMVVCEGAQLFQHDDVIFAIDGMSHIE